MTPTPEENALKDAFLREMGFSESEIPKVSSIRNREKRRSQWGWKSYGGSFRYDEEGKIIEDHSRLPSADLKDNASRLSQISNPFYWRDWIRLNLGDSGKRRVAFSKRST